MKNWLIISRYNENILWIKNLLKNEKINKIIIINKGKDNIPQFSSKKVKVIKKKNIGREGETYLSFIIENYFNLPDNIWFSQGDPFEHSTDFLKLLNEDIINEYFENDLQSLTIRWKSNTNIPPDYFLRNNNFYNIENCKCIEYFIESKNFQLRGHSSYFDSLFEINYQKFKKKYKCDNIGLKVSEILGIEPPNQIIKYIWSACFFVKKKNILNHKLNVYLKLRNFLLETDSQGSFQGYILERFWPYLLTGISFNNITECYKQKLLEYKKIISFDNTNKKKTKKIFNDFSEIYEDTYSILLINKNDKILSLPGLNIKNIDYEKEKIIVFLTGNIRDAFDNTELNNFIRLLYKKYKNIDIYLSLYENKQKYNGIKWYYTKKSYTKNEILEYFKIKIKDIQFIKPNNLSNLSNFFNIRKNIKEVLPLYNKIIDLKIDIFGNFFQNNIKINFENIINKLKNIENNIYIINDLYFDNLILADCNIYKKFLSILKNNEKNICNPCNNYEESLKCIYNLIREI